MLSLMHESGEKHFKQDVKTRFKALWIMCCFAKYQTYCMPGFSFHKSLLILVLWQFQNWKFTMVFYNAAVITDVVLLESKGLPSNSFFEIS